MNSASERYSRQIIVPEVGQEGQEKLKKAKVLVIGAGALATPVCVYLVSAGVGSITLMDADVVDSTNLGRQFMHWDRDVGKDKVLSLKQKLEQMNPEVQVKTSSEMFHEGNAQALVSAHDFIIDGSDNFSTKFLINDACYFERKSFSHAGVLAFEGQTMTVTPESPCYRCVFETPPPEDHVPNCSTAGIIGPVAGVIGSIQALECIKYLIGKGELLTGRLLAFDSFAMKSRTISFKKNKKCPLCGESPSIKELKASGIPVCDLKVGAEGESYLITFKNNQTVIKAERFLKSENINVEPRVTPRQLSYECGICLEIQTVNFENVVAKIKSQGIEISRFGELNSLNNS